MRQEGERRKLKIFNGGRLVLGAERAERRGAMAGEHCGVWLCVLMGCWTRISLVRYALWVLVAHVGFYRLSLLAHCRPL